MNGVFDGVRFYVIPETAQRLKDTYDTMISLLESGKGEFLSDFREEVSHVICNSSDYHLIQQKVKDSSFSCFVTPKWVFISHSLHYCIPVVIYCLVY